MSHTTREEVAIVAAGGGGDRGRSYVDWPAIIAGAFVAWAIGFVLMGFGSGIGLTMTGSPREQGDGASATWWLIAAALWFIWVQVSSVMAGGYLAGRLRRPVGDAAPDEVDTRDGAHGLLVWAVGAVIGGALALSLASGGVGALASVAGGAASAGAEAAAGALEGEGPMDGVVARLFRPAPRDGANAQTGGAGEGTSGPAGEGGTAAAPQDAAPGRGEGDQARRDILRILVNSGLKGELSEEDKRYISQVVERETGMSAEQARQRVDQYLSQALAELRSAAETARRAGIIGSFVLAATLLVSAIGGWWAAGVGGRHRDENRDLSRWFRLR